MAKRLNNQSTVGDVLKQIIQDNSLQYGINEVIVREAWEKLMGNGINRYTTHLVLKKSTLYVQLSSSVLRDELSYGKNKIIKLLNEELGREVVTEVVLR